MSAKKLNANSIGKLFKVAFNGKVIDAVCIDSKSDGSPKRMRVINHGKLDGSVLMPSEYAVMDGGLK